jgi:hypothetical protein
LYDFAGNSKLCNVSQAISTDMLQQLVANAKDEDKAPPCVALLLRLPKTADKVAAFLQPPGAGKLPEVCSGGAQGAVFATCHALKPCIGSWHMYSCRSH